MINILCEFERYGVSKMQTITAWAAASEKIKWFLAFVFIEDGLQVSVTEDDTPTQKPMRLPASHIRETLKEVFVDETRMRFGDKGMDLIVQWNVHLDWNAHGG
jgi:hypothetical protein